MRWVFDFDRQRCVEGAGEAAVYTWTLTNVPRMYSKVRGGLLIDVAETQPV